MPAPKLQTEDGCLLEGEEQVLCDLLAAVGRQDSPRLVLHAHGGLVSAEAGGDQANHIDKVLSGLEGWERIYLIWRTEVLQRLKDGFAAYRDDPLAAVLDGGLTDWAAVRVAEGGRADVRSADPDIAPRRTIRARLVRLGEANEAGQLIEPEVRKHVREHLEATPHYLALTDAIEEVARRSPDGARLAKADSAAERSWNNFDEDVRKRIAQRARLKTGHAVRDELAEVLGSIALAVLLRFLGRRDHGLHATVVEEILRALFGGLIGAAIWKEMKDDAEAHFKGQGAGVQLLDGLDAIAKSRPVELVVVGHSAGAILALYLLEYAKTLSANLHVSLIFWAPAATLDLTAEKFDAAADHLSNFAMLCLTDKKEKADALDGHVFGLYPRSLLYLVSGLFDGTPDAPLLGMERHRHIKSRWLSKAEQAARAKVVKVLKTYRAAAWTCPCGGDCTSETHGSFTCDQTAHATTLRLIAGGFADKPKCPGEL